MNDEDFARHVFARAVDDEPSAFPSLDRITTNGRRAARNRQGVYAAGSVAIAGAVTAGVMVAPTMLSPSGGSSAALFAEGSASGSDVIPGMSKPSGVACSQPPQIDWDGLLVAQFGNGAGITPIREPTCVEIPVGRKAVEALFNVTHPSGTVEIGVETGLPAVKSEIPARAQNLSPSPNSSYDPTAKVDALKTDAEEHGDAARKAAEAQLSSERAAAEAQARKAAEARVSSEGATTLAGKSAEAPQCSALASGVIACIMDLSNGDFHGIKVQLFRTTASQLAVTVIATAPKPTSAQPSPAAPLGEDQLVALAQAVAAHF